MEVQKGEMMVTDEGFKKLEERVKKLEERIFIEKKVPKADKFKGLSGGIRFLINNNFFDVPKSVEEIKKELDREGYFYPYTSIHKIMIDFVKKRTLTRIREADIWKYVTRK
jgi:hypothetical protein